MLSIPKLGVNMNNSHSQISNRIGIHYYPDSNHYREQDIDKWLPELKSMGMSWLVLISPEERAIPEFFLTRLIKSSITPIIHFPLCVEQEINFDALELLFNAYARWGVKHICLFDRPNNRKSWSSLNWTQDNLVEQFLDLYLPLATRLLENNISPIFPPLEPGGDYWDTTFLRLALRGMQRRGMTKLLDSIIIGAYAWINNRPLNWGFGGPEHWPSARPYSTPPGVQDQIGFRIFDWYSTIIRAELGEPREIIVLKAGEQSINRGPNANKTTDPIKHIETHYRIIRSISGNIENRNRDNGYLVDTVQDFNPFPDEVIACNFWLLASSLDSPHKYQTWYKHDGGKMPIVEALKSLNYDSGVSIENNCQNQSPDFINSATNNKWGSLPGGKSLSRPIRHYLLLPLYAWGVAEWDLDFVRPFIQRYHPTLGFSLNEALISKKVTLVGNTDRLPKGTLDRLRAARCMLEKLNDDGTLLAI